ncbi:MAG: uracil phosphoribosyltransferase, partial [Gemmatimonadota bacterium]
EVGGNTGQALAVEQLERLGLHLREGGGGAGGAVDDQLQDFAGFGQVGAALQVLVASLFLGLLSRFGDPAAFDRQLNEKGFILPGLGDAGDRLFGT